MKLHRLQTVQRLPVSLSEAWDFFQNPKNLRHITPAWLDFNITNEVPDMMNPGTIIAYTIRPLWGIPVQWVTEITHLEEPFYFVDEQRFGPYKMWHHQHNFKSIEGGVEIEDTVHYGIGYGFLGNIIHESLVRRRLQEIFTFRAQSLEKRFGVWQPRKTEEPAAAPLPPRIQPQPQPRRTEEGQHLQNPFSQQQTQQNQKQPATANPQKSAKTTKQQKPTKKRTAPEPGKVVTLEDIYGQTGAVDPNSTSPQKTPRPVSRKKPVQGQAVSLEDIYKSKPE